MMNIRDDDVGVQVGQILLGPAAFEKLLFRAVLPKAEEPSEITDAYRRFPGRWSTVPPTSKLGEAIGYARRQMPKIVRYLDAWFLTPDNNAVERAIRPFVIGRSNWLFSDTPRGAHASAALCRLVGTAKANGLEPYHYFRYLFTHLPAATSEEDFKKLLPMSLKPTDLLDL